MKLVVVPILLLLLMTQAFSKWAYVLQYNLNKDYIANVLCENKEKVELKCKGKCQLAKKLAADEGRQEGGQTIKINLPESLFLSAHKTFDFAFKKDREGLQHPALYIILQSASLNAVFHPPAFA